MGIVLLHILPSITLCFLIQLFLHEFGHFIGGKVTGWRFLYLQIFHIVIYKRNKEGHKKGMIQLGIESVPYTACQCIMHPKTMNQGAMLYTMGGCLMNLLGAFVGIITMVLASNPILWLYAWCFLVFGLALFIINGIASVKQMCNDKACYKFLKSDRHTVICHNAQLMLAKYLFEGLTYRRIGEERICLCPEVAVNDIKAYQAVIECYYHLDKGDIAKARECIDKVKGGPQISRDVNDIVCSERAYIDMLTICQDLYDLKDNDNYKQQSQPIVNEEHIQSMNKSMKLYGIKGDIHRMRVMVCSDVYMLLNIGDRERAQILISEAIHLMEREKCIYEGERTFCINQLRNILTKIKKSNMKKFEYTA